jgi:hypothetical protein
MARATIGMLATIVFFGAAGTAPAQQQGDSLLKNAAKLFGFATDVSPPADFVEKTRPSTEGNYIPVFQPPPEPARPALKDKDLSALKGDLDSVEKQHDSLRQAFPPSAKAVAEQQAQQQKSKTKAPAANH